MKRLQVVALMVTAVCMVGIIFFEFQIQAYKRKAEEFAEKERLYEQTIREFNARRESNRQRAIQKLEREEMIREIIKRESENPAFNQPAVESAYGYDPAEFPEVKEAVAFLTLHPANINAMDIIALANVAEVECNAMESDDEVSLWLLEVLSNTCNDISIEDSLKASYSIPDYSARPSDRIMKLTVDAIKLYALHINEEDILPEMAAERPSFSSLTIKM